MLGQVTELIRFRSGKVIRFGGEEFAGGRLDLHGAEHLEEFRLEGGLPLALRRDMGSSSKSG